jgi:hypothetical protein
MVPIVAVLAGCGSSGGGGYPAAAKTNFLNACEARASAASCTCEFAYVTKHVSFSTFAAADKALRNGTGGIPAWLLAAARSCAHFAQTTTT